MISFVFFGFVAAVFVLLLFSDKIIKDEQTSVKASNLILLISSYLFMFYADWRFAIVLAVLSLSTWYFPQKKSTYKIGIIAAVSALVFFKYTRFFVESFAKIFGTDLAALNIILPLGISFYTFSAVSYIVDVSRGKIRQKSLAAVSLYLAFFPKITSGPIQRSEDFFEQIENRRIIGWSSFSSGIQIFIFG